MNFGNLHTPYYLGTIQVTSGQRAMGSSAGTSGLLVLNGTGTNNLILDNQAASVVTISSQVSGSGGPMSLRLVASDSAISVGNASGSLLISAPITEALFASRSLTKIGPGKLSLGALNSYTGTTTVSAGSLALTGSWANTVGSSSVISLAGGTSLDLSAATVPTLPSGKTLSGSGSIINNGSTLTFTNNGTVIPGGSNAAGTLTYGLLLNFTNGGDIQMEIGGTGAGQFDALSIEGVYTAGGTITVSLIGGYMPSGGETFQIFQGSGTRTGTQTFNLPSLSGGLTWDTSTFNTDGKIRVSAAASVTVTSPNGGESWVTGSTHNITWTSALFSGNVDILLSSDGGSSFPTTLFSNIANSGTQSWTIGAAPGTTYRVRVRANGSGTPTDDSDASFTIVGACDNVAIGTGPSPAVKCAGDAATFSVSATGTGPLGFQWRKDTNPLSDSAGHISGSGSATLTVSNLSAADMGSYDCVVSNTCPSNQTSGSASLTVNALPATPTGTAAYSTPVGTPITMNVTVDSGATADWLSGSCAGSAVSGGTGTTSLTVTPSAAGSTTYFVRARNANCSSAACLTVVLTACDSVAIATPPASATQCAGTTASFTVAATGTGPLHYLWRKDTIALADAAGHISGSATATLSVLNIAATDIGSYDCVVTNDCPSSQTSSAAALGVTAAPATPTGVISYIGAAGVPTNMSVSVGSGETADWYTGTCGGTLASGGGGTTSLSFTPSGVGTTTFFVRARNPATTCSSPVCLQVAVRVPSTSPVVISQIYGGGGNGGATYTNDFVELFNRSASPVTMSNWSVQYESSSGSSWNVLTALNATLAPGQYYLVRCASGGAVGVALPAADATSSVNLSGTDGHVVLVNNTTSAITSSCPASGVVDEVGFGSTSTVCNETTNASKTGIDSTKSFQRLTAGATDTDNNLADFAVAAVIPRNSGSTQNPSAPASASASATSYCSDSPPSSITLNAVGGSGATLAWYTGSCGGTLVGTGNGLVVPAPATITTYYARWESFTSTSTCAQATVTVTQPPSGALAVAAIDSALCSGGSTSITVAASESGVSYQLLAGSTPMGSAQIGTGGTLTFPTDPLSADTTFSVVATSAPCSPVTLAQTALVTVSQSPSVSLTTGASPPSVCGGGATTITVAGSEPGVSYQLMLGTDPVGAPQSGNGGQLNFPTGAITVSPTTFTITATRPPCPPVTLAQFVPVTINPSPIPPAAAMASPTSFCTSSPPVGGVALSVSGGFGDEVAWFVIGCNVSQVGVGNPLVITSLPTSTTRYFASWRNSCGSTNCAFVDLVVNDPTTTSNPAGQTVCSGLPASFNVTAGGTGPFHYQWKHGAANVGTDSPTFSIAATTTDDAGNYTCTVTGECGPITSSPAALVVNASPVAPTGVMGAATYCSADAPAMVTLMAIGGSGDVVKWYKDACGAGTPVGTGPSITIATPAVTTDYFPRWETASCGNSACAAAARITINTTPPAPTNLAATPSTVCSGDTVALTADGAGGSISIQWFEAVCGGTPLSSSTVHPTGTTTYYARTIDSAGSCTSACLSVTVTVNPDATISTQPPSAVSQCSGFTTTFGLVASGQSLTYLWQQSTDTGATWVPAAGVNTNATYTTDPLAADQTLYRCQVSGTCGSPTSNIVTLTVTANPTFNAMVELQGVSAGPFTRCITFEFYAAGGCPGPVYSAQTEVTFTNGTGAASITTVPCGVYTGVSARDRLHTLRRVGTSAPVFDASDASHLAAAFTSASGAALIGGNANDDAFVDILDFGAFVGQNGTSIGASTDCNTTPLHTDFSGNGSVGTEDFTFIQGNFLVARDADPCGSPLGAPPVQDISVAELVAAGQWDIARADLNHDGRLNSADVVFAAVHGLPGCVADFNGLDGVTLQDIFDYLTSWMAGHPAADTNRDRVLNVQDLFDFLEAWFQGC